MIHTALLGTIVVDKITGFKGLCTAYKYYLHDNPEVLVTPTHISAGGNLIDPGWFTLARISPLPVEKPQIGFKDPV